MLKRAKIYSLLCIIVASTVVGLFSLPQSASAQTTSDTTSAGTEWNDKRMINAIKAQAYRDFMAYCIKSATNDGVNNPSELISFDNAKDSKWFNGGEKNMDDNIFDVGYLADPSDDGKLACSGDDSVDVVTEFLSLFGWSDPIVALCALGYVPVANDPNGGIGEPEKDCSGINGTGGKTYAGFLYPDGGVDVEATVKSAIDNSPGAKAGVLSNGGPYRGQAQYYLVQKLAYINKCSSKAESGAQNLPVKTVLWDTQANNGSGDGSIKDVTHPANDDNNDKIMLFPNPKDERTCQELSGQVQGLGDASGNAEAYLAWLGDNKPAPEDNMAGSIGSPAGGSSPSSCQVTGIGWIVCPVMNFLAGVVDSAYWALDRLFLRLPPVNLDTSDPNNGTYKAWAIMRDLANIIFVIAFLAIVFSQVTNIGITNYGIKRLIPKLVMAAILVNLSYIICAVAVDLSNIIGSSLKDLLDSVRVLDTSTQTEANSGGVWQSLVVTTLAVSLIAGAVILAWATTGLLFVALLAIVPIIMTVLITMLVRQAFVVLLIVISPLAFVALLLPNTEGYYKKWLELFKAMLLLYPIVAFLFGASALASDILMAASAGLDGGDGFKTMNGIVAGVVRILPLVMIPAVMKVSSGIFGRVTGMVNDRQKGWFDAKRNQASDMHKVQKAEQGKRLGNFVNSEGGMFGGKQSRRRRFIGSISGYGASNRELRRKDELSKAQSNTEAAYLGESKNVEARNAAKNAQVSLQNAQVRADTIRIEGAEGLTLQHESMDVEKRKQAAENRTEAVALSMMSGTAAGQAALVEAKNAEIRKHTEENRAETVAIEGASHALEARAKNAELSKQIAENESQASAQEHASQELKIQAETSSQNLSTVQNRDKQAIEELRAKGSSDPSLLATHGVSAATADAARTASFESKAVDSAASYARHEGEVEYSKEIQEGKTPFAQGLANTAGGNIDTEAGKSRAQSQARSTIVRAFNQSVGEQKDTMSNLKVDDDPITHEAGLRKLYQDSSLSEERRAAAISKVFEVGSADDVREAIDFIAKDDPSWSDKEKSAIKSMRQQTRADVGSRKPIGLGNQAMSNLAVGAELGMTVEESLESRVRAGKITAEMIAQAPVEEARMLQGLTAKLKGDPEFKKLQQQIVAFRTNPQLQGKQPAAEITSVMDIIAPPPLSTSASSPFTTTAAPSTPTAPPPAGWTSTSSGFVYPTPSKPRGTSGGSTGTGGTP